MLYCHYWIGINEKWYCKYTCIYIDMRHSQKYRALILIVKKVDGITIVAEAGQTRAVQFSPKPVLGFMLYMPVEI